MTITQSETLKHYCILLNQLYELEKKVSAGSDTSNAMRNITKMKDAFERLEWFYEDPMGQTFKETRTDLEATISGSGTEDLQVVEVMKPIIRQGSRQFSRVAQKGIVIVESKPNQK
jgi:hypothetical protein